MSLLITMAILGVVAFGIIKLISNLGQGVKRTAVSIKRDEIARLVESNLRSGASLLRSFNEAAVSDDFYMCLSVAEPASDCQNGTFAEFSLYDASGTLISGTTASPVFYNTNGVVCSTPGGICAFETTTRFVPTCTGGTVDCTRAAQFEMEYIVVHHASAVDPKRGLAQLRTASGRVVADVQTILGGETITIGGSDCDPGEYVSGLNADASVKCTALPVVHPKVQGTCPAGQYLRGVQADGSLICENLPSGACAANHYVQSINNGVPTCNALPNMIMGLDFSIQSAHQHNPGCPPGYTHPTHHFVADCGGGTCLGNQKICYNRLY